MRISPAIALISQLLALNIISITGQQRFRSNKKIVVSNKACKDDENFLYRNMVRKGCKWIAGHKRKAKKKLCQDTNVSKSCPVSCKKCKIKSNTLKNKKCPETSSSSIFGNNCKTYKDGMECNYKYVFTGCTWNDIQCSAQESYNCHKAKWKPKTLVNTQCTSNVPNDLPLNEKCTPCPKVGQPAAKCPKEQPISQSKCDNVGLRCNYDFQYTGCDLDQLKCQPIRVYTCGKGKKWTTQIRTYWGAGMKCPTIPVGQTLTTTSPSTSPTSL